MNLSIPDKIKFHESMDYFANLLQQSISAIDESFTLKLLSFGIPIEDGDDYQYFDFPYVEGNGYKIDLINELLKSEGEYNAVDDKTYRLLESIEQPVKYAAYNFNTDPAALYLSKNVKSHLPSDLINLNHDLLIRFFPVMFYSAFPEKWGDTKSIDAAIQLHKDEKFPAWFIVIHNESIQDSTNKIISNYCLLYEGVEDNIDNENEKFKKISKILENFSCFYGSKDYNVILRKNFEYSETTLAINAEIYHHIKELHLNMTMYPIERLATNYPGDSSISLIRRNTSRIQQFYNDYVLFLNSKELERKCFNVKDYFDSISFSSFYKDICILNADVKTNFIAEPDLVVNSYQEYFDIVIKELSLNGIKAFNAQQIPSPVIQFEFQREDHFIKCQIISFGTTYRKAHELPQELLGSKLLQVKPNGSERGSGFVLINKVLKKMKARLITDNGVNSFYFKTEATYQNQKGFNVVFYLPIKKQSVL